MFTNKMRIGLGVLALAVLGCNSPLPTDSALPVANSANVPAGVSQNLTLAIPLPKLPQLPIPIVGPIVNQIVCALPDTIGVDIGPDGGTISIGGSSLVVPAHSLPKKVHIKMRPAHGKAAVHFAPEGLKFNPDAEPTLTLNTDCAGNPANPYIVYTDDYGNVLERLTTTGRTGHTVSAKIKHFSRYAVGW
jgi:hypothetical protein